MNELDVDVVLDDVDGVPDLAGNEVGDETLEKAEDTEDLAERELAGHVAIVRSGQDSERAGLLAADVDVHLRRRREVAGRDLNLADVLEAIADVDAEVGQVRDQVLGEGVADVGDRRVDIGQLGEQLEVVVGGASAGRLRGERSAGDASETTRHATSDAIRGLGGGRAARGDGGRDRDRVVGREVSTGETAEIGRDVVGRLRGGRGERDDGLGHRGASGGNSGAREAAAGAGGGGGAGDAGRDDVTAAIIRVGTVHPVHDGGHLAAAVFAAARARKLGVGVAEGLAVDDVGRGEVGLAGAEEGQEGRLAVNLGARRNGEGTLRVIGGVQDLLLGVELLPHGPEAVNIGVVQHAVKVVSFTAPITLINGMATHKRGSKAPSWV